MYAYLYTYISYIFTYTVKIFVTVKLIANKLVTCISGCIPKLNILFLYIFLYQYYIHTYLHFLYMLFGVKIKF